uniref:baculoviral IAP repeat-containing protein 5-like isoform X1 n=1 Tax=Myxine glutinosa TaxID=7769 RepID=UPI00358F295D
MARILHVAWRSVFPEEVSSHWHHGFQISATTAAGKAKQTNRYTIFQETASVRLRLRLNFPVLVEMMAEAGFVSLATESEPTAVRCFFCCKELDSWHPDDDPRKEDTSHSLSCAFNNLTKDFSQLQVQEFLLLELERARFHIKRVERMLLKRFDEDAESGRRQMSRFIR